MDFIYILLNIVQGAAEFLPISSSGHIIIVETLAKIDTGYLEAFLHLPSAIAIGIFFFPELLNILKDRKQWIKFLVAMIPGGLIGLLLGNYIDLILYSPIIVGFSQIFWGAVMLYMAWRAQKQPLHQESGDFKKITLKQATVIGIAQILALVPGTSRSGITTMAGMAAEVPAQTSAKFSFLIGFPIIFAASVYGFYKLFKAGTLVALGISWWAIGLGFILSIALSILCMKLFTSKHVLKVMKYSAIYRILIGLFILIWLI